MRGSTSRARPAMRRTRLARDPGLGEERAGVLLVIDLRVDRRERRVRCAGEQPQTRHADAGADLDDRRRAAGRSDHGDLRADGRGDGLDAELERLLTRLARSIRARRPTSSTYFQFRSLSDTRAPGDGRLQPRGVPEREVAASPRVILMACSA